MKAGIAEAATRAGVFFRADAPAALRNQDDPYLPVFIEIINGVEKSGRSNGGVLGRSISRQPIRLLGVSLYPKPTGARHRFSTEPLQLGESKEYSFDARTTGSPALVSERLVKNLEVPVKLLDRYLGAHFLGGPFNSIDLRVAFDAEGQPKQSIFLRVRLRAGPLPAMPGWLAGDPHVHSAFTDNPAERGYPPDVTKQAALLAGLHWVVLTDHSTDLDAGRYAEELDEVKTLRDGRMVLIRGEEVTVASGKNAAFTTLHLLAFPSSVDPDRGFPDPADASNTVFATGDGSPGSPAPPVKAALDRIAASGGFAYAAHPFDPISPLLRGGTWDLSMDFLAEGGRGLRPGMVGLEPWNRATLFTADDSRDPFCLHLEADPAACFQPDPAANTYARLERGIAQGWLPLLRLGLQGDSKNAATPAFKVFLGAGTDAHGDFDYEATMDAVDFLSKPSRGLGGYAEDNALGKLFTVVHCPAGMGEKGEGVLRALERGQSVLSNGPLLVAGFDMDSNGSLDDRDDIGIGDELAGPLASLPPLQLAWVSNEEFGPVTSVQLLAGGISGESESFSVPIPQGKEMASGGLVPLDLRGTVAHNAGVWQYIRLEMRTRNAAGQEFRCYTNPLWLLVTRD